MEVDDATPIKISNKQIIILILQIIKEIILYQASNMFGADITFAQFHPNKRIKVLCYFQRDIL